MPKPAEANPAANRVAVGNAAGILSGALL